MNFALFCSGTVGPIIGVFVGIAILFCCCRSCVKRIKKRKEQQGPQQQEQQEQQEQEQQQQQEQQPQQQCDIVTTGTVTFATTPTPSANGSGILTAIKTVWEKGLELIVHVT